MTVKELIDELKKYPEHMEVMCAGHIDIEEVYETTWQHKQVVIIF